MLGRWVERLRAQVRAILSAHLTPTSIGRAVTLGVFIGLTPFYGLHIGMCLLAARWLRLNQAVVYGAANISNPLFAPFVIAAEIAIGEYLRFGHVDHLTPESLGHGPVWELVQHAPDLLWSCTLGSLVLGVVLAPLLGVLAWAAARARLRGVAP